MRRPRRRQGIERVQLHDVLEEVSEPMALAAGHPLRGQRCLLCGSLIGGRDCRLATLIDLRGGGCSCGAIDTITMLICSEHGAAEDVDWMAVLTGRWVAHHARVPA